MSSLLAVLAVTVVLCATHTSAKKVHYIHWNRNNPMFRQEGSDHVVEVNKGNLPWEYDQANLICPVSKPGTRFPESHVIYSVSREEYDSCRITNPRPRIVAICNKPHRLMYFTITFRSFTPTPGGLEFRPGQDYYFISTSSREDLHRRVGGGCSTHNMRMIFKVHSNVLSTPKPELDLGLLPAVPPTFSPATPTTTPPSSPSIDLLDSNSPRYRVGAIYTYHPRDLIRLEETIENNRLDDNSYLSDVASSSSDSNSEAELWRNEALRYMSSSSVRTTSWSWSMMLLLPLLPLWLIRP
jgi:ephrin-B